MEDPTPDGIERGIYGDTAFTPASPQLIYYVRIFGLQSGDVEELSIADSEGAELASLSYTHDGGREAEHTQFVKALPAGPGWTPGFYQGQYRLIRGGTVLLDRSVTAEIKDAG